jgi:hypothetical protein
MLHPLEVEVDPKEKEPPDLNVEISISLTLVTKEGSIVNRIKNIILNNLIMRINHTK